MKHICVIGNSQVGALKSGYDLLKPSAYKASFWAVPGGGGPKVSIKSNRIVVPEQIIDKIKTDISHLPCGELDISRFDAILLSGVGIPAIRKKNITIHTKYLAAGYLDSDKYIDRQILSKKVLSLVVEHSLNSYSSFKNINLLESVYKKKIYIQLMPLPTSDVVNQEDFDLSHYGINVGRFLSWYFSCQSKYIENSIRGKNISIIKYPEMWLNTGFTPCNYKSSGDAWHMNQEFGKYVMGQLNNELLIE